MPPLLILSDSLASCAVIELGRRAIGVVFDVELLFSLRLISYTCPLALKISASTIDWMIETCAWLTVLACYR